MPRARRRAWPEEHARREVLDLPLAIDRRVRHDGDRLVQVVREIRARGERRERAVVAEGADGLVPRFSHERGLLEIVGLEPQRRELPLAPDRDVLDLVGRDADLPAPARVHALRRPAADDALAQTLEPHAVGAPRAEELLAHGVLIKEAPTAVAAQRDPFSGAERIRIADVALERHEAALAR